LYNSIGEWYRADLSEVNTRKKLGKWKRGLRYFSVRSPFSSWYTHNTWLRTTGQGVLIVSIEVRRARPLFYLVV
jgi:hypothetical protein